MRVVKQLNNIINENFKYFTAYLESHIIYSYNKINYEDSLNFSTSQIYGTDEIESEIGLLVDKPSKHIYINAEDMNDIFFYTVQPNGIDMKYSLTTKQIDQISEIFREKERYYDG